MSVDINNADSHYLGTFAGKSQHPAVAAVAAVAVYSGDLNRKRIQTQLVKRMLNQLLFPVVS